MQPLNYNQEVEKINSTFDLSIRTKAQISQMNTYTVSTSGHKICMKIPGQLLREISKLFRQEGSPTSLHIQPKQVEIHNQSIILSSFKLIERNGKMIDNEIVINNDKNEAISQIYYKYFTASISKLELIIELHNHFEMKFIFHDAKKSKFAKTQTLQKLITQKQNKQVKFGILSMDQSARILVQEYQCKFPSIGIWCTCENFDTILVYHQLQKYLKEKRTQKCCFVRNQKRYIYFAKISSGIPQLYYISWVIMKTQDEQKIIQKIDIQCDEALIELSKTYLQFTLRCQEDPFKSPKKQLTNDQVSEQLENLCLNSPGFSSIKKKNDNEKEQLKAQCEYLRQKVITQQQAILEMQSQMKQMMNELERMKNKKIQTPKHHYESLRFMKSPSSMKNSSTPQVKCKRLSESDLYNSGFMSSSSKGSQNIKSNSRQTRESKGVSTSGNSLNSSSGRQLDFKEDGHISHQEQILEVNDQCPWDVMEIIEE